jgi:MYXO-CTERM domain-containing protein
MIVRTAALLFACLLTLPAAAATTAPGFRSGPYPGEPVAAARQFLAEHGPALHAAELEWAQQRVQTWRGRTIVRMQQLHHGVPVVGGVAVVKLDRDQRVTLGNVVGHDELTVAVAPTLDAAAAARVAVEAAGFTPEATPAPQLAVMARVPGGSLVYRVHLSSAAPIRSVRVTVDAHSGAVIAVDDLRREASGWIYETSPHGDPQVEVEIPDLEGDMDVMEGAYAQVNSAVFPDGAYAEDHLAVADGDGDFFYEPADPATDDPFVEVMAYYHVTESAKFFESVHGHEFTGTALVTTNYREEDDGTYDNAFYTQDMSGNTLLVFGQGWRDFAYDASVIVHEFGHSIVQETTNMELDFLVFDEYGWNNATGGIHEGVADYWAGTYVGDSAIGDYVGVGRDMLNDKTCPEDLSGESHDDGEIVGAATWDIQSLVGKEAADAIVYGGLSTVSTSPSFAELAEMMASAAWDLAADGDIADADAEAIEAALEERGMLRCGRALPMELGEEFEFEVGFMFPMDDLPDYMCELMHDIDMRWPPMFQVHVTTPPAEDGVLERLEIDWDVERMDGQAFDDDDLDYAVYMRLGEPITFDYEQIDTGMGWILDAPILDQYDLEFTGNPNWFELEAADEDFELPPDTTVYIALVHQNCATTHLTITPEAIFAAPSDDDDAAADDDDDDDGCSCRQDAQRPVPLAGAATLAALGGIALLRRRR